MRLTVNLEPDLYAVAKSLAKSEDCSISAAVNHLLRRCLTAEKQSSTRETRRPRKRNGFLISRGTQPITADDVRKAESEDDEA
jgi:hypothetical protein